MKIKMPQVNKVSHEEIAQALGAEIVGPFDVCIQTRTIARNKITIHASRIACIQALIASSGQPERFQSHLELAKSLGYPDPDPALLEWMKQHPGAAERIMSAPPGTDRVSY